MLGILTTGIPIFVVFEGDAIFGIYDGVKCTFLAIAEQTVILDVRSAQLELVK